MVPRVNVTHAKTTVILLLCFGWKGSSLHMPQTRSFSSSSSFQGISLPLEQHQVSTRSTRVNALVMRKQKASDKRTRRLQREGLSIATSQEIPSIPSSTTLTQNPMADAVWNHKTVRASRIPFQRNPGGRGRSRKRSNVYDSLSTYHGEFLNLLTAEYQAEVS